MDEDDFDEDYPGGYPEDCVSFTGCSCEHEAEEHGWGSCDVEGCPCEGGWEE